MDVERLLDFIFPPVCISCNKTGQWICSICYKKYFKRNRHECMFCRRPSKTFYTHKKCFKPTQINQCIICWHYNKLAKKIMKAFKYDYRYAISNFFVEKLYKEFRTYFPKDVILIPVPSHPHKLKERGFNQSLVLVKRISKVMGLKYLEPLERIKESHQHAGMKRKERISDENPFKLKLELKEKITGKNLMLIDDVCTTGTTLTQCAAQLRKANPSSVSALALFRGKRK